MKKIKESALLVTGVVALATAAWADGHIASAIKARQSQMRLYAYNLGQLGAMAKMATPYDAEAASKAAANLVALTSLDQSTLWPEGSDTSNAEGTRALPALWTDYDDVIAKSTALNDAVAAMGVAAGTDLASLQEAMKALGGACGACHKAYRQPKE